MRELAEGSYGEPYPLSFGINNLLTPEIQLPPQARTRFPCHFLTFNVLGKKLCPRFETTYF